MGQLHAQLLHTVGGKAQPPLKQQLPLILGENAVSPVHRRNSVVSGPQKVEPPDAVAVVEGQL